MFVNPFMQSDVQTFEDFQRQSPSSADQAFSFSLSRIETNLKWWFLPEGGKGDLEAESRVESAVSYRVFRGWFPEPKPFIVQNARFDTIDKRAETYPCINK